MTETLANEITELSEVVVFGAGMTSVGAEDVTTSAECHANSDNYGCSAEVSKTK